jgi:hypothetical protein
MIFHLGMRLDATTPPGTDLFNAADRFRKELHALANQDGRLDCAVGVAVRDRSSGTVEVDLDVEADVVEEAFPIAVSWLRTALHAAGVSNPGWELGPIQIDPLASLTRT